MRLVSRLFLQYCHVLLVFMQFHFLLVMVSLSIVLDSVEAVAAELLAAQQAIAIMNHPLVKTTLAKGVETVTTTWKRRPEPRPNSVAGRISKALENHFPRISHEKFQELLDWLTKKSATMPDESFRKQLMDKLGIPVINQSDPSGLSKQMLEGLLSLAGNIKLFINVHYHIVTRTH